MGLLLGASALAADGLNALAARSRFSSIKVKGAGAAEQAAVSADKHEAGCRSAVAVMWRC
jgi:hypothetical protein